jgi:Rrf2 family protein
MLSLTCKLAVRAVIYLASKYKDGTNAGIKEISEAIDASDHTVGKLLQTLVKQKVINSVKGPSGGFYISKEQLKRPIITIVEAIDGKEIFSECGLGLSKCSALHPCPVHHEYKAARDLLKKLYTDNRIIDLCTQVNSGLAHLSN